MSLYCRKSENRLFFDIQVFGGDGIDTDTVSYTTPADALLLTGNLGGTERTPGYPALIAFLKLIFGKERYYYPLVVTQIVVGVAAITFLWKTCIVVFENEMAARLVCLFEAVNLDVIHFSFMVLTDSLTHSIAIIVFYYYYISLKNLIENKILPLKQVGAGTVLLLVCTLIRPAFYYLPACLLAGYLFVIFSRNRGKLCRQTIGGLALIILISYLPTSLWTRRNEAVYDYSGYSTVQEYTLYIFHAAVVYAKENDISYYDAVAELSDGNDPVYQEYLQSMSATDAQAKRGKELILSDVPYYLFCCLIDFDLLYFYPGGMDLLPVRLELETTTAALKDGRIAAVTQELWVLPLLFLLGLNILVLLIVFLYFIRGMILYFQKNDWIYGMFWLGILLYFTVVYAQPEGFGSFPRFRTSVTPFYVMFSAYYISCKLKDVDINAKQTI